MTVTDPHVDWKRLYFQLKEVYDELDIEYAILDAEFRDTAEENSRLQHLIALLERRQ